MYNLFYYSDIVSLPPHIYISKKTKNPTIFGFILSLITYISIIFVSINNFLQLHNKEIKSLIYSNSQELNNRTLNNSEFIFGLSYYGSEEFKSNISFNISLIDVENKNETELKYVNRGNYYQINDTVSLNGSVHCIIQFYCLNNNCSVFKNEQNYIIFHITYITYSLNHSNFDEPLTTILAEKSYYFFPEMQKNVIAYLSNVNYVTKGGINWNKKEKKTIISEDLYEKIFSSNENIVLGNFIFQIDLNNITYERIYPSIKDILSNIGGFISIMKTITFFIFIIYSEINSNIIVVENLLKKENSKINNKIILSYKMNDIKNIEPIFNNSNFELNETKGNLIDKDINKNNDEEYNEFKNLFKINFCEKICKCFTSKNKKKLMYFCKEFVSQYLSVESIILNQIYFEEYFTKINKYNNESTNDELKYDDKKDKIQDT